MEEVSTIGLDIAKQVFHAHGADATGATVFSRRITRQKLIGFFASQSKCTVAMEACAGAHHWGRELIQLGFARAVESTFATADESWLMTGQQFRDQLVRRTLLQRPTLRPR